LEKWSGEEMAETTIVGAGLAGLTAAINLARAGREVTVLEKGKKIGASVRHNPSPHGTPLDPEAMASFIGIDLTPALVPQQSIKVSMWGKGYTIPIPLGMPTWMIERGQRRSSMDHYLYRLAREAGVRFEFDHPILSERQLRELPPKSIIATGLHLEGFEAAGVPYQLMYGAFANCKTGEGEPRVTVYYGDYTTDYAFTCSVNGIGFALIFNRRRPIARWEVEKFAEEAALKDGYAFKKFQAGEVAALPIRRYDNPRIFQNGLILAGSLAGMIDPILCFGMHGAFVSGALAARAVADPEGAAKEFRRMNRNFPALMAISKVATRLPQRVFMKYPARLALGMMPLYGRFALPHAFKTIVPGYRHI
jgi:flavin-dependent dehydrogenase